MFKILKVLFFSTISLLFFFNFSFSIKIGLDSGHSIKELYKSGGAFMVKEQTDPNKPPVDVPYFSVAWPKGGVKVRTSDSDISTAEGVFGTYVEMNNSVDFANWNDAASAISVGGLPYKWQDVRWVQALARTGDTNQSIHSIKFFAFIKKSIIIKQIASFDGNWQRLK